MIRFKFNFIDELNSKTGSKWIFHKRVSFHKIFLESRSNQNPTLHFSFLSWKNSLIIPSRIDLLKDLGQKWMEKTISFSIVFHAWQNIIINSWRLILMKCLIDLNFHVISAYDKSLMTKRDCLYFSLFSLDPNLGVHHPILLYSIHKN